MRFAILGGLLLACSTDHAVAGDDGGAMVSESGGAATVQASGDSAAGGARLSAGGSAGRSGGSGGGAANHQAGGTGGGSPAAPDGAAVETDSGTVESTESDGAPRPPVWECVPADSGPEGDCVIPPHGERQADAGCDWQCGVGYAKTPDGARCMTVCSTDTYAELKTCGALESGRGPYDGCSGAAVDCGVSPTWGAWVCVDGACALVCDEGRVLRQR